MARGRYKRRYKRRMRGMLTGKRKWRRRRRIPKYDEVKTHTTAIGQQAISANVPAAASTTQYKEAFLYNSMLNQITQGTDFYNRIGNQIYVLNIKFKLNVWLCSTNLYELSSGLLRINVGEPVGTSLTTDFANYYRYAAKDRIIMPLNRKQYTFAFDRTYHVTNGYTNRFQDAVDPLKYAGCIKHIEFNIPINRRVEYTTLGAVKNQRDQLSLFATAYCPNAVNAQQIFCSDWSWTIYYVDA